MFLKIEHCFISMTLQLLHDQNLRGIDMRPTAKNLVCKKALPIPHKNRKNLLGVASTPLPPGRRRVKACTNS